MSDVIDRLRGAVRHFVSRPSAQPPFTGPVAAADGDGLAIGRAFLPEASYVGIRLVEMRLAEGGKYFTDFLPLGICVAEYSFGAERRRVPLVLSNDLVKQMLGEDGPQSGRVHFKDMPVVRRTPVRHDNLTLFVGLFRMPYEDIARSVLQLAADVSAELGSASFGAGAKVAAKLYERVADVFELGKVTPLLGFLDGNALTDGSRYLLVSGPLPAGVTAAELIVEDRRLRLREKSGSVGDCPPFDYCLLAIEQTDSLFPPEDAPTPVRMAALAALPFHQAWRDVTVLLAKRETAEAEAAFGRLRAEVLISPDLTEADRLAGIFHYDTAYAVYEQRFLGKPGAGLPASRGSRSGTPLTGLKAAAAARKKSGDPATAAALSAIALQLQRKPAADGAEDQADQILLEVSSGLGAAIRDAQANGMRAATLSDALMVATSQSPN